MKFKAAILFELNKPLEIEEIENKNPLQYGQVLVKIICSGICGAQLNEISGAKGPDIHLPHLLGHEATAIVEDVGPGVSTLKLGDKVVCHWRKNSSIQAQPAKYFSKKFPTINAGWVTTFSEYSIISENRLTKIPNKFDPEIGALIGCSLTTALGVINRKANVKIGETVAIFGAGGVGLSIVNVASLILGTKLIVIDIDDLKLNLARNLGATHTINSLRNDPIIEINKITNGEGVDVSIENTGIAEVIETAYECTNTNGRTILVGVPHILARKPSIYTLPLHHNKSISGTDGGESQPYIDIPRLVCLCENANLNFQALIGSRFKLENINDAINMLKNGKINGRCIVWN